VLFLRSVLFAALIPGTVVGLVPYLIVSGNFTAGRTAWGAGEYAGLLVLCLGALDRVRALRGSCRGEE